MTIVLSQCIFCKNIKVGTNNEWTCSAFPEGIPEVMTENKYDHRHEYPGDHGVHFEPKGEISVEYMDFLFGPLDDKQEAGE